MATRKPSESRDFRADLTNQIIDLIEQGTAPWQKPWNPNDAAQYLALPFNGVTGRAYRGGNAMHLMALQTIKGYDDPRWCTYKQAEANGWQVRRGEKGTTVEYWQFDREEERDGDNGEKKKVRVKLDKPRVFYATVFNVKQIDGVPEREVKNDRQWTAVEDAEKILQHCGIPIFHDQADKAYYAPMSDEVHLPPRGGFASALDYYEVAMHELGHATGHPTRLNRDLSGSFGSESYAREELRAQMASLFLSAELGIPFNPERHAAYQGSWVKALREDKNEIFRAAKDAELIADYLIGLAREKELAKASEVEQEQGKPTQQALIQTAHANAEKKYGDIIKAQFSTPGAMPTLTSQQTAWREAAFYEAVVDTATAHYSAEADREAFIRAASYGNVLDSKEIEAEVQANLKTLTAELATREAMRSRTVGMGVPDFTEEAEMAEKDSSTEKPKRVRAKAKAGIETPAADPQGTPATPDEKADAKAKVRDNGKEKPAAPAQAKSDDQGKGSEQNKPAFDSELERLKDENGGKGAKLVKARDEEGKAYTGTIIAETGDCILQKVSEKYVVVHSKATLTTDVEVGSNKQLAYSRGTLRVNEPGQTREKTQEKDKQAERHDATLSPEQEKDKAFFQMRGTLIRDFGDGAKVRKAITDPVENGGKPVAYRGVIVNMTIGQVGYVAQQVGANSFVLHDKDRISGNYEKRNSVEIKYNNGRGISTLTQQQREQNKEQQKGMSR